MSDDATDFLRALWVALDFLDIAASLPKGRVKSVRLELNVAVAGDLWPRKGSRQPLQFQTQHWIGAVLRRVGVEHSSPAFSSKCAKKSPDFLIADGLVPTALEVKRPEVPSRIAALIADGRDQLAASGTTGGVILEISDCLKHDDPEVFQRRAAELATLAFATVWRPDGRGFIPGFERVTYVGVIARGARLSSPEEQNQLRAFAFASGATFAAPPHTLADHKARRLQAAIHRAFDSVVDRIAGLGIPAAGA